MKVVLKGSIIDRILSDIAEGQRKGRDPEYIVLTREEYSSVRCYDWERRFEDRYSFNRVCDGPISAMDTMTVRDFPYTGPRGGGTPGDRPMVRRVPEEGHFMGIPVFVVPAEYMPR